MRIFIQNVGSISRDDEPKTSSIPGGSSGSCSSSSGGGGGDGGSSGNGTTDENDNPATLSTEKPTKQLMQGTKKLGIFDFLLS